MNEVMTLSESIKSTEIKTKESFDLMGGYLVDCTNMKKEVHLEDDEGVELANKTHKHLTGKRKVKLDLIESVVVIIKSKRLAYKQEQDRIAEEAQRKAEEEERKRVEAEQERLLEEAARQKDTEAQEVLLQEAEEVTAKPVFVPKPIQKTSAINGGGLSTWVKDIEIRVVNEAALCRAISDGKVPMNVIEFKLGKLKTWIKTMDIRPGSVPGLYIKETQRESVRS